MKQRRALQVLQFVAIILFISLAIGLLNRYGIAQLQQQVQQWGVWAPLGIFLLRFTSVVIPALPGTAYLVLAGGLLGFAEGFLIVGLADLLSCSLSFLLARRYGRGFIQRLVGKNFIDRVDTFSQRHLESNFFLMAGCLMTGLFDFVCYGLGLTSATWFKFLPALAMRVAIANPPFVALGAGLLEGSTKIVAFALLGVFGLGIITALVQRNQNAA